MDTTDPNIIFDENGVSDYYHNYINKILPNWNTEKEGQDEMFKCAEKIKESKNKDFDCIIGVSGGWTAHYTPI